MPQIRRSFVRFAFSQAKHRKKKKWKIIYRVLMVIISAKNLFTLKFTKSKSNFYSVNKELIVSMSLGRLVF